MNFIYHHLPEPMVGTQLIPLNKMPNSMSETRDKNLGKYKGRDELLERNIPLLNCLWNDVVQFIPVHPQKIFQLQQELGLIPNVPPYNFYEIDLKSLDSKKTVIFFMKGPGEENIEVKWLSEINLTSITEIPQATIEYYKSLVGTGELPFNYQFIPHILHQGSVDISGVKIITLSSIK